MQKILAALAPLALLVPTAISAEASVDPATIKAGTYSIDSNHTQVQFSVNHFGFNNFFGILPRATGTLTFDPKAIAATKLDVSVPVDQVATTNATLDSELKSANWFDAATYPTIRFVSSQVKQTGPRTALISGTVTFHGVSKPLVLNATFGGAGTNPMNKRVTAGFQATGTLKRSEFGVTRFVPMVSDAVTLTITAAFEQK